MAEAAIEVRGLTKAYGRLQAVAGVDLTVGRGEIFALLGPNGAGKTTTVEILEGFGKRDGGEVRVLGEDPAKHRASLKTRIGIVPQETAADPFLTVRELVKMIAGTYPRPLLPDEAIELVGLGDKRDTRAARLSGGQQRRLDVALALVGDPELLFLDEPTTGFDPDARREAWAMLKGLKALGKTVLLTTHYMEEAQQLADRVAVIAGGRIIAEGTPATLGIEGGATSRIRFRSPPGARPPVEGTTSEDGLVTVDAEDPVPLLNRLTSWAISNNVALADLEVARPSLEERYLELVERDRAGPGGEAR
ncbi:ABC transporter ATP-binding protein [Sphingomonas sp.]|uniref:ABC transporter ATP-binding protein n=1 Tax=Sphingomonas sp. TaxID=28214 RepID=UPI001B050DD7|nr:ABC transporter ATP-binding protein [Sphingomonas sp.]MBO9713411.1 ABC transporter ATP-binding protein [Sphingomonas sp.]